MKDNMDLPDFKQIIDDQINAKNYIYVDCRNHDNGKMTYRLIYLVEKEQKSRIKHIYISENIFDEMLLEKRSAPFWMDVEKITLETAWSHPLTVVNGLSELYDESGAHWPYVPYNTRELIVFELENNEFVLGAC